MNWVIPAPTPFWVLPTVTVAGGVVGYLLWRILMTTGYRLDDELDRPPPPRALNVLFVPVLAVTWGLLAWRFGPAAQYAMMPAYLGLATVGAALIWVDADVHRLPRGLTRPAGISLLLQLTLTSAASGNWQALWRGVIAAAALWAVYVLLALGSALLGSAFGFGDVSLAPTIGLAAGYLGAWAPVVATYAAFILAGAWGLGRIALRRATRKDHLAFGPWMLIGLLFSLFLQY